MGVRFACHGCGKRLNIKSELAGRRGICPQCSTRFRIPNADTARSMPIESSDGVLDGALDGVLDAGSDGSSSLSLLASASAIGRSPSAVTRPQPTSQPKSNARIEPADVIGDAATMWYVRPPGGGQYGPADGPTMRQWIAEGRVAELSMIWRNGWADWAVAREALSGVADLPWDRSPALTEPQMPISEPTTASGIAGQSAELSIDATRPVKSKPKVSRVWITAGLFGLLTVLVGLLAMALGLTNQ